MVKRTRTAVVATALAGGALLLAGCGGQAATNSAATPETPGTDAATSTAAGAGDHASGTHDDISASNCAAEDFEITLQPQPNGGVFLLEMKNTSEKSCEIGGWVDLTPLNMANQPTDAEGERLDHPGPPQDITLEPGRSAFSGVKVELSGQGDPDAQVASGFTAAPSDMAGEVNVDVKDLDGGDSPVELPIKSFQVGTLQPSPQGVVAF
ncbi:DUF4232 domain-containing protein [Saccharopolyspora sp. MS10]|uniref:DUF4232 domain-containing protein n=1 Tax=Saccharopolyspora sp. MS10 TaxID=3385973 RepID=UPI0039A04D82